MKHNYKVARRVYGSIYTNIAEKFKIYIISLKRDEIDEIENDFRVNGNSLLSAHDTGSTTELFNLFAMFYYINGRLPYTDGHLFVPNREIPLFAKSFWTKSNVVVSALFLAALLLFFVGKESLVKNFLTELYRNLMVEVVSSDNCSVLEFQALTDLCPKINVRLANSIFANHENESLNMKKQDEDISKKKFFFDDDDDVENFRDDVSTNQESDFPDDVLIKQESDHEIVDRKTIPYVKMKLIKNIQRAKAKSCSRN